MNALMHVHLTQRGFVYLGYGVCFGVLGLYTAWLALRGRKLTRALPPDERTWQ